METGDDTSYDGNTKDFLFFIDCSLVQRLENDRWHTERIVDLLKVDCDGARNMNGVVDLLFAELEGLQNPTENRTLVFVAGTTKKVRSRLLHRYRTAKTLAKPALTHLVPHFSKLL
jgi:hypothetical protein